MTPVAKVAILFSIVLRTGILGTSVHGDQSQH